MRKLVGATMFLLAVVGVVCSSGCSAGGQAAQPTGRGPAAHGVPVAIRDHRFDPRSVGIGVGDTVTWTNYDNTTHVVSGTGFSSQLAPGTTYSHRFDHPGTYEYICTLHPDMVGIVVVR